MMFGKSLALSDPIYGAEAQKLNFESNEIRLVLLKAGEWKDEIECELRVVGLNEKPKFIAVSYSWGSESNVRNIRVNGHDLAVPLNLFTGLRRMRDRESEVIFWADRISINQKDERELNDQVAQMTQIYRQCQEARVFLDDYPDDASLSGTAPQWYTFRPSNESDGMYILEGGDDATAFRLQKGSLITRVPKALRHHSEQDPALGAFCLVNLLSQNKHFRTDDIHFLHAHRTRHTILMKLREIMQLPWWSRQWVVQETVFSRKVTLQFQGITCPWDMFASGADKYREHIESACCSGQKQALPPKELDALDHFTRAVTDLDYWRRVWGKGERGLLRDRKINLLQLLWQFRTRQSSIPKDKVYALLALVNDWERVDPIRITYSYSDSAVFQDVVTKMIAVCRSLSVLMGNTGTLEMTKNGMPSWTTDWGAQPDPRELERLLRASLYAATGESKPGWRILPGTHGESILELKGFSYDTVTAVSELMPHDHDDKASETFKIWESFLGLDNPNPPVYRDGSPLCEAYWRTVCMNTVSDRERMHHYGIPLLDRKDFRIFDDSDKSYADWLGDLSPQRIFSEDSELTNMSKSSDSPDGDALGAFQGDLDGGATTEETPSSNQHIQMDEAVTSATACRRLFKTREGFIGVGPARLREGDEVWLLLGGSMPFLLRPAGEYEFKRAINGKRACHKLVGESYIHGIMSGQAMEQDPQIDHVWLV